MSAAQQTEDPVIHFLSAMSVPLSLSSLGVGRVFSFGDELRITDEIREASKDRNGDSWLRWLDEGADEYRRGDKVIARRGPWPVGRLRLDPGSYAWEESRRKAIAQALAIEDPAERRVARQRVDELYGPGSPTSRTLAEVTHRDGAAR